MNTPSRKSSSTDTPSITRSRATSSWSTPAATCRSGVFGDMMLTYFKGKGGLGVVIDGCIRDYPNVKRLDLGLWVSGVTPNFHTQTDIMPFAVNVPIACGGVFVMPGDIIVADDDGAVVVPVEHGRGADPAGVRASRMGSFLPRAPPRRGRFAPLLSAARGRRTGISGVAAQEEWLGRRHSVTQSPAGPLRARAVTALR